jgi:hypothetical protein
MELGVRINATQPYDHLAFAVTFTSALSPVVLQANLLRFKDADAQLPFNNRCYFLKRVECYRMVVALGDLMVSVRACQRSRVQTRPRTMGFLRTIKIRSSHSFGGTVKPPAPSVFCPKILLHVKEQYDYERHTSQVKLSISSAMIFLLRY